MPSTVLTLSDATVDFDQFVSQFQSNLQTRQSWKGTLPTQTSSTLVDFASAVGTFAQGRIRRSYEDAYAETALSDDAILSIAQMQGLRITRWLPSAMTVTLTSSSVVSIPPLTQFSCAGNYFFNRQQLTLAANSPTTVTLYEGQIYSYGMAGLGTERQTWVSTQDSFVISDQDVWVQVNGTFIPKSFGTLWNYDGLPAFADLTLSDGRLITVFGNLGGVSGQFGTIPQVNDIVTISYPVTQGQAGDSIITLNKAVTVVGFSSITGVATSNPTGGSSEKSIVAYKNVASGSFGTYSSAVTKSQYQALIATYPGVKDAVTQAQREIDPGDVRWMNVIRVSALTSSPWTQDQIQSFLNYCQSVTMYAAYFLWQDPIAIPRDVNVDVFVFNSAIPSQVQQNSVTALTNLFAPRPGLLMTNFYTSDLIETVVNASPGQVSYVRVNSPIGPMIVTAPESPLPTFTILPSLGTLGPLVYAYAVSTTLTNGDVGYPTKWIFPQITDPGNTHAITLTWPAVAGASSYQVWGRQAGGLGLLANVPATSTTFTDNGSITPSGGLPSSGEFPIRYNSLASLTVNAYYSERQQPTITDADPTRLLGGQ